MQRAPKVWSLCPEDVLWRQYVYGQRQSAFFVYEDALDEFKP